MLENIRLAFQGIWSHMMRSFLTMLGIIIGIASIIAIVSTIKGTSEQIKEDLIGAGSNTVNVYLYDGDNRYDAEYGNSSKAPVLTDDVKEDWWKIDKKFVKYGSEVNWLRKLLSKLGKYAAGVWIYYTIVYSMYIIQILSSLGGTIKSWVLLYLIGVAISFAGAWLHQKIARSNVNIEERYEKGN